MSAQIHRIGGCDSGTLRMADSAHIDFVAPGFLPPLSDDQEHAAFLSFHAVPTNPLRLVEGVRRNFAIKRDFETVLHRRVTQAISNHFDQKGAIVLHGQSGIRKTIALGRLNSRRTVSSGSVRL
jgi:hypothetical protein